MINKYKIYDNYYIFVMFFKYINIRENIYQLNTIIHVSDIDAF